MLDWLELDGIPVFLGTVVVGESSVGGEPICGERVGVPVGVILGLGGGGLDGGPLILVT